MLPSQLSFNFVQQFQFNDGRIITEGYIHYVPFSMPTNGQINMYPRADIPDDALGEYGVNAKRLSAELATERGPLGSSRCFQDLIEYAMDCPFGQAKYVHGMMLCHQTGRPFEHAWVEHGPNIIESKFFKGKMYWSVTPATHFAGRVQRVKKYTRRELLKLFEKHGNCGPWEKWMLIDVEKDRERLEFQYELIRAIGAERGLSAGNAGR